MSTSLEGDEVPAQDDPRTVPKVKLTKTNSFMSRLVRLPMAKRKRTLSVVSQYSVQSVGDPIPHLAPSKRSLSPSDWKGRFAAIFDSVFVRFFMAFILVSFGLIALWLSIQKSDTDPQLMKSTTREPTPPPLPPSVFTPFINQVSKTGTYYSKQLGHLPAEWYQNDDNKEAKLIIGSDDLDFKKTYYIYGPRCYFAFENKTTDQCTKKEGTCNYTQFIRSFGDERMELIGKMKLSDHGDVQVRMFAGVDQSNPPVLRYVAPYSNLQLGWTGFVFDEEKTRFELWFGPESILRRPDDGALSLKYPCTET